MDSTELYCVHILRKLYLAKFALMKDACYNLKQDSVVCCFQTIIFVIVFEHFFQLAKGMMLTNARYMTGDPKWAVFDLSSGKWEVRKWCFRCVLQHSSFHIGLNSTASTGDLKENSVKYSPLWVNWQFSKDRSLPVGLFSDPRVCSQVCWQNKSSRLGASDEPEFAALKHFGRFG